MTGAVTQHDPSRFTSLQTCKSLRLLEFTQVELLRTVTPGSFGLAVSGDKPYANVEVMLSPLTRLQQPECWGIEVVRRLPHGFGLTVIAPYTVTIPLDGTIDSKGIGVLGSNKTETTDVPQRKGPLTVTGVISVNGCHRPPDRRGASPFSERSGLNPARSEKAIAASWKNHRNAQPPITGSRAASYLLVFR